MSDRMCGELRVSSKKTGALSVRNTVRIHGISKQYLKKIRKLKPKSKKTHQSDSNYFFDICNSAKNAICALEVTDQSDFIIRYLNPIGEKMLGVKFKEVYGKSVYGLDRCIVPETALTLLKTCLNTKKDVEHTFFFPEKEINIRLWPICRNNHVIRIVGINTMINRKLCVDCFNSFNQKPDNCEDILKEQLKFEELISKSLKGFMDAGNDGFDDCLSGTIKEIGKTFDADQVFVVKASLGSGVNLQKNQWAVKKEWLNSNLYCVLQSNKHNEWHKILRSGKMLIISDILNSNGAITNAFQNQLKSDGIRSLLVTPIKKENEYWGFLCITQIKACRIWTVSEIGMIKIAAETIMSAYLRTKLEKQLSESNRILIEYDQSLQEMLALEEMLTDMSKAFITEDINNFGRCVHDMLGRMGEIMGVDRISVSMCKATNTMDYSCYEWSRKGIARYMKGKHQNMNKLPHWHKDMFAMNSVVIDNTSEQLAGFPQSMGENILQMGIKSLFAVPIKKGSKVLGMFMFQKVIGYIKWPEAHINMAKVAAEIFIGAFLRQEKEQELRALNERLAKAEQRNAKQAVKTMNITNALTLFADADEENFYNRTKKICQKIARETLIRKISIYKFANYPTNFLVYNWNGSNISIDDDCQPMDTASQIETILSNPVIKSVMNAQVMMAGKLYKGFVKQRTVGIPIRCADKIWGFLYVSADKNRSEWEENEIRMLRLFGELFAKTNLRIFTSTVRAQKKQFNKTLPGWV